MMFCALKLLNITGKLARNCWLEPLSQLDSTYSSQLLVWRQVASNFAISWSTYCILQMLVGNIHSTERLISNCSVLEVKYSGWASQPAQTWATSSFGSNSPRIIWHMIAGICRPAYWAGC